MFSYKSIAAGLVIVGACAFHPAAAQVPIKIGFIAEMSGLQAVYGQDAYDAFMMYVEKKGGKLGGVPVQILKEDSQNKPELAVQIVDHARQHGRVTIGDMIRVTGATAVDWPRRLDCCGDPLHQANTPLSERMTRAKITDALESGAEAICTVCPHCHLRFDAVQSVK